MKHVKILTRPGTLRAQATTTDKIEIVITVLGALASLIPLLPVKESALD